MDTRTGDLFDYQDANKLYDRATFDEYFIEVDQDKLKPIKRARDKISRNSRCVCGSGKKFKKCCLRK